MNRKTPRSSDRSSGVFEKRVVCSRLWGKNSGRSILSEFKNLFVDRKHGRNNDQECGCSATVKMTGFSQNYCTSEVNS